MTKSLWTRYYKDTILTFSISNRTVFSLNTVLQNFYSLRKNSGTQHGIQIYVKHNSAHSNFCTRDTNLPFNKSLRLGNRFWRFEVFLLTLLVLKWSRACSKSPSFFALRAAILYSFCLSMSITLVASLAVDSQDKKKDNYQRERPHSSHFEKLEDNNSIYLSLKKTPRFLLVIITDSTTTLIPKDKKPRMWNQNSVICKQIFYKLYMSPYSNILYTIMCFTKWTGI